MRTLTAKETESLASGYGVPGGVVGGGTSAIMYTWNWAFTGQGSLSGLALATGVGAGVGAICGPVGIARAVWAGNASTVGGVAIGIHNL